MDQEAVYSVVKHRGAGGSFESFLVQNGVPLVLPYLWIHDAGINCRANTVEAYLRDIKILYEWAAAHNQDLNALFKYEKIFSLGQLRSIATCLCKTKAGNDASAATCNRRRESVCRFIEYAFYHFIHHENLSLAEQFQAEKIVKRNINRLGKFITFHINASPPAAVSSELGALDLAIIDKIIKPGSPNNPYKAPAQQMRNYCIYRVAIETLARRSELVLMEIGDVELGDHPTLTIKATTEVNIARRKDGASLKTKGRTVPVTHELKNLIYDYIKNYRTTLLVARRPCTALFVSSKDGRRLSSYTINSIFAKVGAEANELGLKTRLHPHGLRATGANKAREKFAQGASLGGIEMTEALSYMGGWTQGSAMVRHYTKGAMSEQLGKALRNKVEIKKIEE